MKKKSLIIAVIVAISCAMTACMGSSSSANATGGELTGIRGSAYNEPVPYGMTAVHKGSLKVGLEKNDTLGAPSSPPATSALTVSGWTSRR